MRLRIALQGYFLTCWLYFGDLGENTNGSSLLMKISAKTSDQLSFHTCSWPHHIHWHTKSFAGMYGDPFFSTHCRCKWLLFHLITFNDTHTHTREESSGRGISPSQTPLFVQHTTLTADRHWQTSMAPAEFEIAIPVSEGPQTHALDSAVTGTGLCLGPSKESVTFYTASSIRLFVRWLEDDRFKL
jgi:hypothetical protein